MRCDVSLCALLCERTNTKHSARCLHPPSSVLARKWFTFACSQKAFGGQYSPNVICLNALFFQSSCANSSNRSVSGRGSSRYPHHCGMFYCDKCADIAEVFVCICQYYGINSNNDLNSTSISPPLYIPPALTTVLTQPSTCAFVSRDAQHGHLVRPISIHGHEYAAARLRK